MSRGAAELEGFERKVTEEGHGDLQITPKVGVAVLVLNGNKILLGKRAKGHGAGTWAIAGGHLKIGESFEEGAAREVEEELGLEIDKNNLELVSVSNDIMYGKHYITLGFLARSFAGGVRDTQSFSQWGWFDIDKLPSPIFIAAKRVIDSYLLKKIYWRRD